MPFDSQEDFDLVHRNDQQKFLASSGFLSSYGMPLIISSMQVAAREVLQSLEFMNVLERSLQVAVDAVVGAMKAQPGGGSIASGMPLAKLIPRAAQMSHLILNEPAKNEFIEIVHKMREIELFFTLLYSNIPAS